VPSALAEMRSCKTNEEGDGLEAGHDFPLETPVQTLDQLVVASGVGAAAADPALLKDLFSGRASWPPLQNYLVNFVSTFSVRLGIASRVARSYA
jgi:hypothetical protein